MEEERSATKGVNKRTEAQTGRSEGEERAFCFIHKSLIFCVKIDVPGNYMC